MVEIWSTFCALVGVDGPDQDALGSCVREVRDDAEDVQIDCHLDSRGRTMSVRTNVGPPAA